MLYRLVPAISSHGDDHRCEGAETKRGIGLNMNMVRIARSNRLPESLPVVLKLLEEHGEGVTIPGLQAAIEEGALWAEEDQPGSRASYYRIYGILKLLASKGIVQKVGREGREVRWLLDRQEYAKQRRRELTEVIQPFVDGCLMVSDPEQFVEQLQEMVEDGTIATMLAERRARGRRRP